MSVTLTRAGLDELLAAIARRGYRVLGPTLDGSAIELGPVSSTSDLPEGWGDEQSPGRYRLRRRDDAALFGFTLGARSLRHVFQPPETRLYTIRRRDRELSLVPSPPSSSHTALLGVRACELAALAVHDRVLRASDAGYAARRDDVLVVAVTCGSPSSTCFCTSMGGDPEPTCGFDVRLTELLEGEHRFIAEAGTARGEELLSEVTRRDVDDADRRAEQDVVAGARRAITRHLDTERLPEQLAGALEHPRWEELGHVCVACTSCTLVCPTCFCTATRDVTPIGSDEASRVQAWDSCFSPEHSQMHGGSARPTVASRYRQWVVHKLSTWVDQFGTSGCVGCGRCLTWCPAGIDLTAEVATLRHPREAP